jgi:anti-anti-sigma regulatory factor
VLVRRDSPTPRTVHTLAIPPSATIREAASLHAALRDAAAVRDDLTVDFTAVERCDSSALQLLLACRQTVAKHGRRFRIVNVSSDLLWRFELLGLEVTASPSH